MHAELEARHRSGANVELAYMLSQRATHRTGVLQSTRESPAGGSLPKRYASRKGMLRPVSARAARCGLPTTDACRGAHALFQPVREGG
jgi:hypothetical protein